MRDYPIDHIGIAVHSLDEAMKIYEVLGLGKPEIEEVPSEKVRVGKFSGSPRIELLEAMGENSPLKKFLEKRGPGIHHICFRVPDIAAAIAHAKKMGMKVINDPPNPGADHCLVSFIHPQSTGGVLIELSQKIELEHYQGETHEAQP